MDYIQEELRRQREALAGLLLGGAPRRGGEPGADGEGTAPAFPPSGAQPDTVPAGAISAPEQERAVRPAERVSESLFTEDTNPAVPGQPGLRPWEERPGEAAAYLPGKAVQAAPAEYARQSGGFARPETIILPGLAGGGQEAITGRGKQAGPSPVPEYTVTEFWQAADTGAPAGAEALSRAFQRDARRYDGGFSLY